MYALQSHERDGSLIFNKKKEIYLMYLLLPVLGLVAMLGLSLAVVHTRLTVVASLVVDDGLYGLELL